MTLLRLGMSCVLCVGCFQPQGKPDGETSASGSSGADTGATATGAAATTDTTGATGEVPTTGTVMPSGDPTTETGEPTATTMASDATVDPSASTTGVEAMCGDNVRQDGEFCDDGNTVDGDGCPADCSDPCGNGELDGGEQCDDGNEVDGDGCNHACVRDALYVFVTEGMFESPMGGLDGADKNCQAAAAAAGLTGKYRAWLSDDVTPAIGRVTGSKLPYVRRDGVLVAANIGAIIGMLEQKLMAPINVTETKKPVLMMTECGGQDLVWTGTSELGAAMMGANCGNWTDKNTVMNATGGSLQTTDARWTQGCGVSCMGAARLYCFELEGA